MSIPRGLDGIGDGCGVRTVEFGLHTRACVGSAHVTQNHDQGGAYPRIQRKGTSVPLASTGAVLSKDSSPPRLPSLDHPRGYVALVWA